MGSAKIYVLYGFGNVSTRLVILIKSTRLVMLIKKLG